MPSCLLQAQRVEVSVDTYIVAEDFSPHHEEPILQVGPHMRPLLQVRLRSIFEFLPPGAILNSAELRLKLGGTTPPEGPVGLHRVTSEWLPEVIWWERRFRRYWDGGSFEDVASAALVASRDGAGGYWASFDVTRDLTAFLGLEKANFGWIVVSKLTFTLAAREDPNFEFRPHLLIKCSCEEGAP